MLCPQHQERFGKPRKREDRADHHHPPVRAGQPLEVVPAERVGAAGTVVGFGLAQAEHQQRNREQPWHHGHPEHGAKIIRPQQHQTHRQKRPQKCTHGIERLPQPEGRAAQRRRGNVGDQRITRRPADALADAVEQARCQHNAGRGRDGEQRFGQRAQRIAEHRQALALAKVVAERAGEYLDDECGRFSQALDQPDRQRARAQHRHHEQRQQAVDHLGSDVHQQADAAEHPDAGGHLAQAAGRLGVGWRGCQDWLRSPGGKLRRTVQRGR